MDGVFIEIDHIVMMSQSCYRFQFPLNVASVFNGSIENFDSNLVKDVNTGVAHVKVNLTE